MRRFFALVLGLASLCAAGELRPATTDGYEQFWRQVHDQLAKRPHFLNISNTPELKTRLRQGHIWVDEHRSPVNPPGGLVHHWEGAIFVPKVRMGEVLAMVQDYDRHKDLYGPDVTDSKLLQRNGNDFRIRMRLLKKKIVTVVLETEHEVRYKQLTPTRWESTSRSTKISEVDDPGTPKEKQSPPGVGHGFVWKMDSFWRFEEADGGVYLECSSLSLSRDIPFGMAKLIRPIINEFPEASIRNVLQQTRDALAK